MSKGARIAGVTAALALVVMPAAIAEAKVEPGHYGGGRIDRAFVPNGLGLATPVAVRVAANGRDVKLYAAPTQFCDPAVDEIRGFFKDIVVSGRTNARDRFRGSRRFKTKFRNRDADTVIDYSGAFDSRGHAEGTIRLRQTVKADDGSQLAACDSRTIKWRAAKPKARRVTGAPKRGAAFFGTTSQSNEIGEQDTALQRFRFPIALRVSRAGVRMENAFWLWRAACGTEANGIPFDVNYSPAGRLRRGGTFSVPETFSRDIDATRVETVVVDFSGRIGNRYSAGSLRMRTTVADKATGETLERCDSGRVSWRAERVG